MRSYYFFFWALAGAGCQRPTVAHMLSTSVSQNSLTEEPLHVEIEADPSTDPIPASSKTHVSNDNAIKAYDLSNDPWEILFSNPPTQLFTYLNTYPDAWQQEIVDNWQNFIQEFEEGIFFSLQQKTVSKTILDLNKAFKSSWVTTYIQENATIVTLLEIISATYCNALKYHEIEIQADYKKALKVSLQQEVKTPRQEASVEALVTYTTQALHLAVRLQYFMPPALQKSYIQAWQNYLKTIRTLLCSLQKEIPQNTSNRPNFNLIPPKPVCDASNGMVTIQPGEANLQSPIQ